jgi:hypothetical protein
LADWGGVKGLDTHTFVEVRQALVDYQLPSSRYSLMVHDLLAFGRPFGSLSAGFRRLAAVPA